MAERMGQELEWKLVYTRARCEAWAEAQLRNQSFSVLLPRVRKRVGSGFSPLYPRYLFVGHEPGRDTAVVGNTRGVRNVVQFGDKPARVSQDVIDEIRGRMDSQGVVHLEPDLETKPLFDRRQRERLRTLVKLAQAGFRVAVA